MSYSRKIVCDRCGAEASEIDGSLQLATRAPQWASLRVASLHGGGFDAHVCAACVPILAELLPHVDRAVFEPFVAHEDSFEIVSGARMLSGQSAQITERRATRAFRATRIEIDRPADWIVHNVRIGNRDQIAEPKCDVPAEVLSGIELDLDTCLAGMDFMLVVKHVGKNPEGAIFRAKITALVSGFAADSAPLRFDGGAP